MSDACPGVGHLHLTPSPNVKGMHEQILEKVELVVSPVLENLGYELLEREFAFEHGRLILRLYIDAENGVTIDDCENASRLISDVLDAENIISSSYQLEVSSPGLDRPLKKEKDFESHVGKVVKIKTREQINGRANYKGVIEALHGQNVYVNVDGVTFEIPLKKIAKARLVPEI